MIPFIQVLLDKRISTLEKLDLSYNQLDDHFAQTLLDVLVHANTTCNIRSIAFEGNPFSEGVLQQMRQIYGGGL